MGVGVEQWRARIGSFRQSVTDGVKQGLGSKSTELRVSAAWNAIPSAIRPMVMLLCAAITIQQLLLANDVELNPGPFHGNIAEPFTVQVQTEITIRACGSKRKEQTLTVRDEIIGHVNNKSSHVHQKIKSEYGPTELSVKESSDRVIKFSLILRTREDGDKLVKACNDGTFAQFVRQIMRNELLNMPPWGLVVRDTDLDSALGISGVNNEAAGARPIETTGSLQDGKGDNKRHRDDRARDQKQTDRCREEERKDEDMNHRSKHDDGMAYPGHDSGFSNESYLPAASALLSPRPAVDSVVNNTIIELLKNKKHTEYHLHMVLKTHNKSIVCLLMLDENGFNMLHQCVEQNRIQFMKVFQAHGYWTELIEQEVPCGSSSEFAGYTPKQMAERKGLRRLVREIERLTKQEKSMSDRNAVLRVCRAGDVNTLRVIKSTSNADMKAKDSEGNNAVHWAAVSGNLETVQYLIGLGIRGDLVNEKGQTPLHAAVMYGHSTLINFLSIEAKLDLEVADEVGKTPLQIIAKNGDVATLNELQKCNVTIQRIGVIAANANAEGKTCLMIAAENGHLQMVKLLLSLHDYNLKDVSKQNRNILHYVADNGHVDVAKYLLGYAAEKDVLLALLNQKDYHRVQQLCCLVCSCDTENGQLIWNYVKLKRKVGSAINHTSNSIHRSLGQEPDVKVLNESIERHKESGNTKDGQEDLTPLMLAIAKGHTEVAKMYIEAGADVKSKDCFGQTAMHLCAMRGTRETAALLDDKGLALTGEDEDGDQPIKVAEMNEHPEMVNFFRGHEQHPRIQECVAGLADLVNERPNAWHSVQDISYLVAQPNSGANAVPQAVGSGTQEVGGAQLGVVPRPNHVHPPQGVVPGPNLVQPPQGVVPGPNLLQPPQGVVPGPNLLQPPQVPGPIFMIPLQPPQGVMPGPILMIPVHPPQGFGPGPVLEESYAEDLQ